MDENVERCARCGMVARLIKIDTLETLRRRIDRMHDEEMGGVTSDDVRELISLWITDLEK